MQDMHDLIYDVFRNATLSFFVPKKIPVIIKTVFGISKNVLSILSSKDYYVAACVYTTVIAKYMYEDEKHNKLYMILRKTYSDCDSAYNYDWHSVTYESKHPELKYYVGIKQIGIQP